MRSLSAVLSIFSLIVISSQLHGQTKAITETGDEVVLYEDGTWKYINAPIDPEAEIPISPDSAFKSDGSTFLIKSTKTNLGFWINPKKWSFTKETDNPEAEYELQLKGKELYAMVIAEKIEIPIKNLKQIAYENSKSMAPDMSIVKEEYRIVNGIKVLFMYMKGTFQGIKFAYYGYYFSSPRGTVQYVTYTSQNLIEEYMPESDLLLNGLVILDN